MKIEELAPDAVVITRALKDELGTGFHFTDKKPLLRLSCIGTVMFLITMLIVVLSSGQGNIEENIYLYIILVSVAIFFATLYPLLIPNTLSSKVIHETIIDGNARCIIDTRRLDDKVLSKLEIPFKDIYGARFDGISEGLSIPSSRVNLFRYHWEIYLYTTTTSPYLLFSREKMMENSIQSSTTLIESIDNWFHVVFNTMERIIGKNRDRMAFERNNDKQKVIGTNSVNKVNSLMYKLSSFLLGFALFFLSLGIGTLALMFLLDVMLFTPLIIGIVLCGIGALIIIQILPVFLKQRKKIFFAGKGTTKNAVK